MIDVPVKLGARSYRILVGAGILAEAGPQLARLKVGRRVVVVTDPKILAPHGGAVTQSLATAGLDATTVLLRDGVSARSEEVAASTWERFLDVGLGRASPVQALAGGQAGD